MGNMVLIRKYELQRMSAKRERSDGGRPCWYRKTRSRVWRLLTEWSLVRIQPGEPNKINCLYGILVAKTWGKEKPLHTPRIGSQQCRRSM